MGFDRSIGDLPRSDDVSAGDWVIAGTAGFGAGVSSLVPAGFGGYARVFHPAALFTEAAGGERPVRWAEVAAANGRTAHPAMEWSFITGSWEHIHGNGDQPGVFDHGPSVGDLPFPQLEHIAACLTHFTDTPEDCWFAVWAGWGDLPFDPGGPQLQMPQRPMILFHGSITQALGAFGTMHWYQSPALWWPTDHAWCVATDVDLMSTYVGASAAGIEALQGVAALEVMEVEASQTVHYRTDTINPAPAGRDPHAR
jgi:hypothetical protein